MQTLTLLNAYIAANLLLLLALAGVSAVRFVSRRLSAPLRYRDQLYLAYALTLAALLLPFALLPFAADVLPPNAQVWSGATMRGPLVGQGVPQLAVAVAAAQVTVSWNNAWLGAAAALAGGALLFMSLLWLDVRRARRIVAGAYSLVHRGAVQVLAADTVRVPFSFWLPRQHFIVVPADLMLHAADLRMAIRHEAQHHRQLDTRVVYVYQLLRAVFFFNPAVHWLQRMVAELQELTCDETLVTRRRISAQAYCGCLLRVAEYALGQRRAGVCASMLGGSAGGALRNRVEALLLQPAAAGRSGFLLLVGTLLVAVMAGAALAATSTVQDRRISMQQALAMARSARTGGEFPIVVNPRVVSQLNRLLGTPDGRAYVRDSLQRMKQYESLITAKLLEYGLPAELIAVPLLESGFRNLPRSNDPRHGAGLWMFIEPTARRFGLQVTAQIDQRLDVPVQTDAAMRLLSTLNQSLGDWGLSLLAYNAGRGMVERGIEATGSRDVWYLIGQGYENDRDYVAGMMAAVLIIRNPAVVD